MFVEEFIAAFDVWEEAHPYIDLIFDQREMQLVVAMQGQAMTVEQVAGWLDTTSDQAAELLTHAYSRCIVNKVHEGGITKYAPGTFYTRLDHFAKYENWDDIPEADRKQINRRFLDEFIEKHRPSVERKMQGLEAENALPNDTVMLLHEVEGMIDAAEVIVVQPCDCRRLGQNCDRPIETCIWLDDGARGSLDRGHGRQLTKQEAKDLLRWTDKKGLMHTADSAWKTRGLHAICNCCACDCYPFQGAQELGSKGVWPKSNYIAVYDRDQCRFCGACVKRCHFDAFYHDGSTVEVNGKTKPNVLFDPDKCWGCGLCANTCTEQAIQMDRLA